ncbi:UDP-2,3-diacylglucosamine diphosphatase [Algiphilus aromaticivorans]|uniref:UDP-2,3-diacylglucosamine diphosphatase n=1 Tax=Algiphilus aromaticivorans TaxID=382454 RepID=UPI0005C25E61|nr:UDP-2,3-diacylglucosamine diphosphatase [Algiphilus aromaticivorans]
MSEKTGKRYRTIWISDLHLGTPGCKAEHLVDFLKAHECETLYLVGDIIDGWQLSGGWYWPQEHSNVIRKLLTKAKRGTQIYYVTGNHDEFLRRFVGFGLSMGNIEVVDEHIHKTADGCQLLIVHGDAFDVITRYHKWIAMAGDTLYVNAMRINHHVNRVRRRLGMPYWSLSAYAKERVKSAVNIVSDFEESVAHECRRRGLDGVVCGHIHHAEQRDIEGVTYMNCGDWVESCTALAENFDGSVEILRWVDFNTLNLAPARDGVVEPLRETASA